jgi:drug/metabolite transporter (DMT)-like permease
MVTWRAWLAFGTLGIIWGLPYFFIRIAVQEVSPFVVAWGRVTLAALVLLPIAWRRGALRSLGPHMRPVCAFALIEFVVPFSAISVGEQWVSSSIAGILISGVPLTVVLISPLFGVRERIGRSRSLGLALGLIGVVALLGFGTISGPLGWAGAACLLLAVVGYAVGPLIIQRHLRGLDSIGPVAASVGLASAVLVLPAAATFPHHLPSSVTLTSILVLGLLCTAVAMLLMFYIVGHAGASRASLVAYINPAVAALLGVGFLNERLGVGGTVGFALILLGSWLAARGAAPQRAIAAEAS